MRDGKIERRKYGEHNAWQSIDIDMTAVSNPTSGVMSKWTYYIKRTTEGQAGKLVYF
jgi:hypothetical protein